MACEIESVKDLLAEVRLVLGQVRALELRVARMACHQVDGVRAVQQQNHRVNLQILMHAVADAYQVPVAWMTARCRESQVVWPRQVAMFLAREVLGYGLAEIAREFRRDHGTIIYAHDTVQDRMETSQRDREFVAALRAELGKRFA